MSMKSPETLVIIGNGIASWRVNLELERKFVDSKIIRIGQEQFAPACSFRTTSINCLRGTRKGISPLGDTIVNSYQYFENCYANERPSGIEESVEYQLWDPREPMSDEKWTKRYESSKEVSSVENLELKNQMKMHASKAYLISPEKLYRWHCDQFKNTTFLDDYVIGIEKNEHGYSVKLQSGQECKANKLFICTGYMSNLFFDLVTELDAKSYLQRCKPVRGTYIAMDTEVERSFSLALDKYHLIYRKEDQKLLIGSTSENDCSLHEPDLVSIKEIYERVREYFYDPSFIVNFDGFTAINGVRHKGAKRMPYWGRLGENLYGMFGLYKNAFSFSYLGGKKLVDSI